MSGILKYLSIILASATVFLAAATAQAAIVFNIDSNFDAEAREQIQGELVLTGQNLYFYVEKEWWNGHSQNKKDNFFIILGRLSSEFSNNIYPTLTSVYGSEWKNGIDNDPRLTVFFHRMKEGASGYVRTGDEYSKLQIPSSNEREMVYLSANYIEHPLLKVFLAHEFAHLIQFNQKDKIHGVSEDIWLNEGRADYTSSLLGYDLAYEGSNLQRRANDFLANPSDSLTSWDNTKYDYAVVRMFLQYVVDHYGVAILTDSLKSRSVGMKSLDEALAKNGFNNKISEIFYDWSIAVLINNCAASSRHCYMNNNLRNIRLSPSINFLPLSGNSSLSVINVIKNWTANWQKVIGGKGDLKIDFSGSPNTVFRLPYILYDKKNMFSLHTLALDRNQVGQIVIKDFDTTYNSLVIMPSLQMPSASQNQEPSYSYSFTISTAPAPSQHEMIIQELIWQIESLKKKIAALQGGNQCAAFTENLYVSVRNSAQVRCLQQFLKNQGASIYPEGLITGYFGPLTKSAVVRFQKTHGIAGTGFVGPLTRAKINELLL